MTNTQRQERAASPPTVADVEARIARGYNPNSNRDVAAVIDMIKTVFFAGSIDAAATVALLVKARCTQRKALQYTAEWVTIQDRAIRVPRGVTRTGSNPDRQSKGLPGHCGVCALVGHVRAHPKLGCAEVGCNAPHGSPE